MKKTNLQHLSYVIGKLSVHDITEDERQDLFIEATDFIEVVKSEIDDLKKENYELEAQIDDLPDLPSTDSVYLGLDTLHYRLEKGNHHINEQLEDWIEEIKKQNNC